MHQNRGDMRSFTCQASYTMPYIKESQELNEL